MKTTVQLCFEQPLNLRRLLYFGSNPLLVFYQHITCTIHSCSQISTDMLTMQDKNLIFELANIFNFQRHVTLYQGRYLIINTDTVKMLPVINIRFNWATKYNEQRILVRDLANKSSTAQIVFKQQLS